MRTLTKVAQVVGMTVDGVAGIAGTTGLLLAQYANNPMSQRAELESFSARVVSWDPTSATLALVTVAMRAKIRRGVCVEGSILCGAERVTELTIGDENDPRE